MVLYEYVEEEKKGGAFDTVKYRPKFLTADGAFAPKHAAKLFADIGKIRESANGEAYWECFVPDCIRPQDQDVSSRAAGRRQHGESSSGIQEHS